MPGRAPSNGRSRLPPWADGGFQWSARGTSTIPNDDGSQANDWLTTPFALPAVPRQAGAWEAGSSRHAHVWVKISVKSGSGSNTWLIVPRLVANPEDFRDTWQVFTPPHLCEGRVQPKILTQADLPFSAIYAVPLKLCQYALLFARSGGGTNVVSVELLVDR